MEGAGIREGEQETLAYTELKGAITKGVLPPGYQLAERQISEQLGMSRSPVRSAIKRLQLEGFLERRPNKRIYVSLPNAEKAIETLYIREALEGMASRLAARNRTNEDLKKLNRIMVSMKESTEKEDIITLYHLGVKLHRTIFAACANKHLMQLAINIQDQEAIFNYNSLHHDKYRSMDSTKEHLCILNCIINQDEDGAEAAARHHIHKILDRVLEVQNTGSRVLNSVIKP